MTTHSSCRFRRSAWQFYFYVVLLLVLSALGPQVSPAAHAASGPKKLKPTDPYALIFGTVWGPDDHPVYGVKVKIRRAAEKKPSWELYSDHHGEFALRVAAGKNDYIVGADLKGVKTQDGFQVHLVEEVPVHVEYDERIDIGLHLAR
ncbi:MAG: carboxypeptidase-like regulatory domain-containing protein [Candidatus Sulfotelmatobacter sp.]